MDQTIAATAPAPALRYDGRLPELYRIFLVNLVLTIVTLSIWRFWGKTRFRRYIWSHTGFQGERFDYTGRGSELLVGWLIVIGAFIGLLVAAFGLGYLLAQVSPALALVPIALLYLTILVAACAAPFAAQRYRLSRTNWLGIRGGMRGSAFAYGLRAVGYFLLVVITLYQFTPWAQVRLSKRLINASSFGTLDARCRARGGRLYLPFLGTLVGTMVLGALIFLGVYALTAPAWQLLAQPGDTVTKQLALAYIQPYLTAGVLLVALLGNLLASFYLAMVTREIIGNTTLGPLRFASAVTGPRLLWLHVGNILLLAVTLGFGYPIVLQRNIRFTVANTLVSGTIDPAELGQSALRRPGVGEGLMSQFDGAGAF